MPTTQRLPVVHSRQLAEPRIGTDQPLLVIENRDRERDRFEEGVKPRDLRAFAPSDLSELVRQSWIAHVATMSPYLAPVNDLGPKCRVTGPCIQMPRGFDRTARRELYFAATNSARSTGRLSRSLRCAAGR